MLISALKTFKTFQKLRQSQSGFSLIEILVALVLAALIFLAIPGSDSSKKHRELKSAIDDIDRSIRFASNEAILRNTVVRLKISLDKSPVEYVVEYGPAGNLPLPDLKPSKQSLSLEEQKQELDKKTAINRQFNKVEEFEDIKHEIHPDVSILGISNTQDKEMITNDEAYIYFYPTGEKDGGLIVFSTNEEVAYIEISPFLNETTSIFETLPLSSVAKLEDILQTKLDDIFKKWLTQ